MDRVEIQFILTHKKKKAKIIGTIKTIKLQTIKEVMHQSLSLKD